MSIQASPIIIPSLPPGTFKAVLRFGCIRLGVQNQYGQPYWHVNDVHARVGLKGYGTSDMKVERDGLDLIVRGSGTVSGEEAGGLFPFPDETLARLGVTAGCSGTPGYNIIRLYRNGSQVDPASSLFNGDGANLWYASIAVQPG